MKNNLIILVSFFVLLFLYTRLASPFPLVINSTTTAKTETFSVTGEGTVITKPDMARINVGVVAHGASVKDVQDQLNRAINAVISSIKGVGVAEKDIKTSSYALSPQYDYQGGTQRITGYQAQTDIRITIRALDKTNAVVDAATAAGANTIGGVTFDVDNKTQALNEARQEAVNEAKKKAQDAARVAGFTLGKIINYQESQGQPPGPIPFMMRAEAVGTKTAPTDIQPGSSEIKLTVTLSYDIH